MNLAGQSAKSYTEPSKLGARPRRINAWLKTRTELPSSASVPQQFFSRFVAARAMLVGSADWRMFATPKPPAIMTCYTRARHDVQVLDQLARRGAHSLGFNDRAACFNGARREIEAFLVAGNADVSIPQKQLSIARVT